MIVHAVKDFRERMDRKETATSVPAQVDIAENQGKDCNETATASPLKNIRRRLSEGITKVFKVRF